MTKFKKWNTRPSSDNKSAESLTEAVLKSRGKKREEYENSNLYNPLMMKDMAKAVEIIKAELSKGGQITIYGDYDCDGITAASILWLYLTSQGGEADIIIPTRKEGYGLSKAAADKMKANKTALLITVDNGITAAEEVAYIKSLGITVIITDHHTPGENLPEADATVNPKQADDNYPYKELAGCGIALKLVMAMEASETDGSAEEILAVTKPLLSEFSPFAAIGTLADSVPLTGENRVIVKSGIANMARSDNEGIRALIKKVGGSVNASDITFFISPMINSAGRIGKLEAAQNLFTHESAENPEIADSNVCKLEELNRQRKELETKYTEELENYKYEDDNVIIIYNPEPSDENPESISEVLGIIGIIAAKLASGKPAVVLCADECGNVHGSARAGGGVNLHKALAECKDLLIKYGGHAKATGCTLKKEDVPEFTKRLKEFFGRDEATREEITIDAVIDPARLTQESVKELSKLEPYGEGNPRPVFLIQGCVIREITPLKDGKFVSLKCIAGNNNLRIVNFRDTPEEFWYKPGDRVDMLITAEESKKGFRGGELSIKLTDIRLSGINEQKYIAAEEAYAGYKKGTLERKLYQRITPDKNVFKKVFDKIKCEYGKSISESELCARLHLKEINVAMTKITLDIFEENELITRSKRKGEITINEGKKADLENSAILKTLKSKSA
ncbi:hypothetical protein FACS1894120_5260 [Clostridia bacterium]|nr:hypothetical protein FACS1894120_5260 [Clostridia bacterium]